MFDLETLFILAIVAVIDAICLFFICTTHSFGLLVASCMFAGVLSAGVLLIIAAPVAGFIISKLED